MVSFKLVALSALLFATSAARASFALFSRQEQECPEGQYICAGKKCIDPQTDSQNCGSCDRSCTSEAPGGYCEGGICKCPGGINACSYGYGTFCPTFATDQRNCGECYNWCKDGELCVNGQCTGCPGDELACYKEGAYKCLSVSSDNDNCGSCGKTCDTEAGASCVNGECVCPAGTTTCGILNTHCRDTQNDRENCGGCLITCPYACKGGKCIDCDGGLTGCFGKCINTKNDNYNCGRCLNVCYPGENCVDGTCTGGLGGCPPDQVVCGGDGCINVKNDNRHCGACDIACANPNNCVNGKCV